jgi:putative N-acetylmannosamine-6-phosphate epimerase
MTVLERLRGRLIVSVQAEADSVLGEPSTIALLARCVVQNGAAAVRIEGLERVRAVRAAVDVPIVGLLKGERSADVPYITTAVAGVEALALAGADAIAFDATDRPRGATVADLIAAARRHGRLAFADCATAEDARRAAAAGADIVGTTLAGYTTETAACELPALGLLRALAALHPFAVCEGGIATPEQAAAAFAAGASAVVVGTAITNVDALTRRFAAACPER